MASEKTWLGSKYKNRAFKRMRYFRFADHSENERKVKAQYLEAKIPLLIKPAPNFLLTRKQTNEGSDVQEVHATVFVSIGLCKEVAALQQQNEGRNIKEVDGSVLVDVTK